MFTVTVSGDTLPELKAKMQTFLANDGAHPMKDKEEDSPSPNLPQPVSLDPPKNKRGRPAKTTVDVAVETTSVPVNETPALTTQLSPADLKIQVTQALTQLVQLNGMTAGSNTLNRFGAKRLVEVDPSKYQELLADIQKQIDATPQPKTATAESIL